NVLSMHGSVSGKPVTFHQIRRPQGSLSKHSQRSRSADPKTRASCFSHFKLSPRLPFPTDTVFFFPSSPSFVCTLMLCTAEYEGGGLSRCGEAKAVCR